MSRPIDHSEAVETVLSFAMKADSDFCCKCGKAITGPDKPPPQLKCPEDDRPCQSERDVLLYSVGVIVGAMADR